MCVDRSDRDNARIVSRRGDTAVSLQAVGRCAVVAASRDHRYAGRDSTARRAAQWIGDVRLGRCGAETKIHHADVVKTLAINNPIDTCDHIAYLTEPASIKHSDI